MNIALVLTTVNVPLVLALYHKCGPEVNFYVIGDRKTDDLDVMSFLAGMQRCTYYGYEQQAALGYKCHALIGPDCIQRRNIGFLEALKGGADIVVSIDDDNIPLDLNYFSHHSWMACKFDGVQVSGEDGWFDPGKYLSPPIVHRGFPMQRKHQPVYQPVTDVRIGVSAGMVLGDPDIDAVTRIALAPDIQQVSLLMKAGAVVGGHTWTVFNSQNTAVIRELVPAWFMMPGTGRHDDIYAGLIVQRVMRERGLRVRFGQPFVVQQRNAHDLLADLRAEISGMENVVKLADLLDSIVLPGRSVLEDTIIIYSALRYCSFLPVDGVNAGLAFLEDCGAIL